MTDWLTATTAKEAPGILLSAYRWIQKKLGKKKAREILNRTIRELLKEDPNLLDVAVALEHAEATLDSGVADRRRVARAKEMYRRVKGSGTQGSSTRSGSPTGTRFRKKAATMRFKKRATKKKATKKARKKR